jgi:competence protein ComEA
VPRRGGLGGTVAATAAGGTAASAPVSLSSATAEQLDGLPGVGPVTAQKIVDYRAQHGAFHSVDELDAIPGIGPARLADLRGLVVP